MPSRPPASAGKGGQLLVLDNRPRFLLGRRRPPGLSSGPAPQLAWLHCRS